MELYAIDVPAKPPDDDVRAVLGPTSAAVNGNSAAGQGTIRDES